MMGKDAIDPPPEETEEATASPQQPQTWPPPVSMATPSTTTGSSRFRGHLIPNIVIDPIPPRDAFGHSHTPPFLQRSASDQPLSFRWSLGIPPGGGKKVRAHSDSAIMQLERHRDIPIDVQQEFQAAREFHHLPQPQTGSGSICRGEPRVTSSAVSLSVMDPAASSPKPMDTSNGSKQTVHSLSPHQQLMETSEYEGQNLPSPSFHSPTEKSPKTYWMRRHSDSNVPEGETEPKEGAGLSISESSQSQRSHSAGDQDAQDPSKLSRSPTEGHKIFSMKKYLQERYILDKGLESGIGTVRIRHDSSDSGSQGSRPERPSTSEDRPSTTSASAPEVIERQTSSGFTVGQTPESQQETAEEPKEQYPPLPLRRHPKLTLKETVPLKTEPISPCESDVETPVFFSPSFISPRVFSESPRWHHVFQFPSARGRHMSPLATESRTVQQPHLRRSCSSSDVQLSVRGETPPPSETITRPEAMDQGEFTSQQHHQQQQHLHRPLQRSPIPRGVDPTRLSPPRYPGVGIRRPHRAVGRSRSEGHTPAHPLSPTPSSSFLISQDLSSGSTLSPSSMSSGSGSLPPFSTMVHQHSLPLSPGLTQPYTSYRGSSPTLSPRPFWSAGMPLSPSEVSPEREIGQQSAATYQSMPLSPPATSATVTSTGQSATTSGGGGRKMDASKMIYCPFGDKIREQRLTQDPGSVFRCPVCSQLFPSYYYLANHMVNHLPSEVVSKGPGDSNKIHLCKVCNRSFSRSDMLTRHMRLHTGLKPYECHICGQVFSRSDHLHTHARTHTGEKPYKCPQCPYAAPRRDMITRHMRIHAKHFSRRGRRTSSTSSDITPQSSTESVEVKRRNQSLSSIESIDSEPAAAYRTSTEHDVLREEEDTKTRNWSLTSGDSAESSEIIPSTTVSRNWSLASTESGEFQSRSYSLESSDYGSPRLLSSWLEAPPDTPSSISAEVQSSFQKCTVASDKESNDSSEKDNTLSPSSSVTMETDQKG